MAKIRRFIDIGANLTDLMYSGIYHGSKKHEPDLEGVLERSWKAGLERIIITGGNLEESNKALTLAQNDGRLFTTVGCHPTRCMEFEDDPEKYYQDLEQTVQRTRDKIVAIGECGLDYDRVQFCPIETQKMYFERQLGLSKQFALPLFLHCRNAADDLYEILKRHENLKGVVHSFDGTLKEAQLFLDLGLYIGLNGCSLKTKDNLETVAQLPDDKLLIETDCPWCEIRPSHSGYSYISDDHKVTSVKKEQWKSGQLVKGRNEPCNIQQVLDVIAAVRKQDPDILGEIIYENTRNLFFP